MKTVIITSAVLTLLLGIFEYELDKLDPALSGRTMVATMGPLAPVIVINTQK